MLENIKIEVETYLSILNKKAKTINNEFSLSFIHIVWDTMVIVTQKHFYYDWFMINRSIPSMLNGFRQLNPYKANKAILRCMSKEQVSLKKSIKKVGNCAVKIERWSNEKHLNDPMFPSQGGWIQIK